MNKVSDKSVQYIITQVVLLPSNYSTTVPESILTFRVGRPSYQTEQVAKEPRLTLTCQER